MWWTLLDDRTSIRILSDGDPTCIIDSGDLTLEQCMQAVHNEDERTLIEALDTCQKKTKPLLNVRIRIKDQSGKIHLVTVSGLLEYSEDGSIRQACGVLLNESYFRQLQNELEFRAGVLKAIADNLPVALWAKDCKDGDRYLVWNKGAEDLSGYSADQVLGKNDEEIFPADVAKGHKMSDLEAIRNGGITEEPLLYKPAASPESPRVNQIIKKVVYNDSGEPELLIGIAEDITETLEIEKSLLAAKEDAERSNRVISDFVSTMSHEIRTPLNAILGFTRLLCSGNDLKQEEYKNFKYIIEKNTRHLLKMINDIFDLSLAESGELSLEREEVQISGFIIGLFKEFSQSWNNPNVEFQLKADTEDAVLFVDKNRLSQVLKHLIGNASKFTKEGYIQLGYSLSSPGFVRFFVRDSGIGIPREKRARIFETCRQGEEGYTRRYGGAGIGLSLSKQLVTKLGGELKLETEAGVGSTFYFNLPRYESSCSSSS